jgi:hypothetical protein
MEPAKPAILNRYTTLPILLDILQQKHITLLSPATWEDWNDAYYLERYKQESKLRTVLAACFSERGETFHHWRVFSNGSSGVCIEFDKRSLLKSFAGRDGFGIKPRTTALLRWLSVSKGVATSKYALHL